MERNSPPNTESAANQRLLPANTNAVPQKRIAGYDFGRAIRRKTKVVQIRDKMPGAIYVANAREGYKSLRCLQDQKGEVLRRPAVCYLQSSRAELPV
jgi:hypothetical protein